MGYDLEQFSAACHQILAREPGLEGRKKVCALVEDVCRDEAFVARYVGDDVPERKILYEDPELGFCILAHNHDGAKESQPHDHGPSWAIYGQARGETLMSDWTLVERATEDTPGKVRLARTYPLKPGMAHVCRVRYLPIAGHKVDSDTKYMAANDAIEVMLRPIPSANVFVPYQITIPTIAGVATIVSKRVDIVLNGKPQIALLH